MTPELIEALELLIFQAIGLTTVAISSTSGGDLTLPKWRALVILGNTPSSVGDLAREMGMSMPSASRLCRRLRIRGLIQMNPHPDNRRITLVTLSSDGRKLRQNVIDKRRTMIEDALSDTDKIPDELIPGLKTITEALGDYA